MARRTPNTSSNFRQGFGWAPLYIAAALIVALIAATILYYVEQRNRADHEAELRAQIQSELNMAALDLSLIFQRNADTIRAVSALISIEPDISFERFAAFSKEIFVDHTDFIEISAAPDLVVDRIYPETGEAQFMGMDFRAADNKELFAHVSRARKSQSVLFAGPIDLEKGGQGIVAYDTVYLDDAEGKPQFWGVVNLVIDFEEELRILGLDTVDFRLAIRGKDARGSHGAIFWGDRSTFAAEPVFATVSLPVGSWVMAAAPTGGWNNYSASINQLYGIVAGITLTVLIMICAGLRLIQLRMRAVAQMSSAINSIQDGFAYYNSDDRLVACNDKYRDFHGGAAKLFTAGTRFEDILRSGVSRGHYAEAIGREEEWVQERLAQHKASGGAVDQKLDDGRWVRMSEARTPDGGTVGFLVDITELVSAKEDAEHANVAKSEFLDVMSHELRTPLTVVLGGTPFLVKPELLPATQKVMARLASMGEEFDPLAKDIETMLTSFKGLAGKVERSARSLLTLINEVLDYSKIEAGRMKLAREMCYCDELIEDVVEQYRSKAEEKGLSLEGSSADLAIFADEPRVRQILDNLVSNAIKFTEKGSVRIEAQRFGDFARFRIIDTGIGIPTDRVDGIFDKFSQGNTSDRRRAGGTGLGLAISKKFVEMHGGTIGVSSRAGEGSEFTFTIPKHMVQKARKTEDMHQKPAA
ncbi:ATP-binding protein [Cognatishimia sp.]|uniref:sensor histidine kinase n=1 Tax=Cognatishimia sp. TaxID=2211648 RepID=UPI003511D5F8